MYASTYSAIVVMQVQYEFLCTAVTKRRVEIAEVILKLDLTNKI